jgi:hypothetical protein
VKKRVRVFGFALQTLVWLAQFWRLFFSTTRLISEGRGHTRSSRGVVMRTTDRRTAVTSKKHRRSSLRVRLAWRSATLEMHPAKTKIIYRKDKKRKKHVPERQI